MLWTSQSVTRSLSPNDLSCSLAVQAVPASTITQMAATSAERRMALFGLGEFDHEMDSWLEYLTSPRRVVSADTPTIRTLDLFSGVGGLALGFSHAAEMLGYRISSIGAVDIDEGALSVYKRNLGTNVVVPRSAKALVDYQVRGREESARFLYRPELTELAHESFADVEVVLAGPPCQGHSSLNNRTRGEDERNLLYLTVPALAIASGAQTVIIENVPNVVSAREGVVQSAAKLLRAADFSVTYGVLAANTLGWPQTRRRFFLVATRGKLPFNLEDIAQQHRREPNPVSWLISDLQDTARDFMDEVAELSPENEERVAWLFKNKEHDMPLHLRPDCHKDGTSYGAVYGRMHWGAPAPTITTGFLTPGRGRFVHPTRARTLTPREAARIQGFPDWFSFTDAAGAPPARRDLAKWIGNAVPTILGHFAGVSALI